MPEGPECRHLTDILKLSLVGKHLKSIKILSGRYSRHGPPTGFNLITTLLEKTPIKILEIGVKGKFIYWVLDNNVYMWNTLGMSGQWTTEQDKHHY